MGTKLFALMVLSGGLAVLLALRFWRRHNAPNSSREVCVKAELASTRTRGWTFFNLVLANHSRMRVAIVDVTLVMTDLVAKFQSGPPANQTTLKIRRMVKPGEVLPLSLIETFYAAAGKPQGGYSFVVAATIRYRAHGDLFEQALPLYRAKMFALSPNALQRIRWRNKPPFPPEPLRQLPELEPADLKWLDAEAGLRLLCKPNRPTGERLPADSFQKRESLLTKTVRTLSRTRPM
jgi:hypothetical protein